jgi:hypothetical protein
LEVVEVESGPESADGEVVSPYDLAVEVARAVGTQAATLVVDEKLGLRFGSPVGALASTAVEATVQAQSVQVDSAAIFATVVAGAAATVAVGTFVTISAPTVVVVGGSIVFGFAAGQIVYQSYRHIAPAKQ